MYNLVIRKCTSPLLQPRDRKFSNENLRPHRGSNPGPSEPVADILPSDPTGHAGLRIKLGNFLSILTLLLQKKNTVLFENFTYSTVIQILHPASDGCRLRPWLACWPASGPLYSRCFQTLTLLFQFIFRVDGHVHRCTFAKRRRLRLLIVIIVIR